MQCQEENNHCAVSRGEESLCSVKRRTVIEVRKGHGTFIFKVRQTRRIQSDYFNLDIQVQQFLLKVRKNLPIDTA